MQSFARTAPALAALTVSELVGILRETVVRHPALTDVLVRGEVSNLSRPPSGVVYFALKDDGAQVPCVLFRSAAAGLRFELKDGIEVLVHGDADVFPAKGQVQLVARDVRPLGRGAFWLAFEQVRDRLASEGLFDPARKRPLPRSPRRIGVVTSEAGAVLHDVLSVLARRYPLGEVLVSPCLVQGDGAPDSIASALDRLAGRVDVAILARGGGSTEDLWAFNDERVARAIGRSPAPVISAVGHETDVTIADFAADVRAPTPSAAAEIAAPDVRDLGARVEEAREVLRARVLDLVQREKERVRELSDDLAPDSLARAVLDARQRVSGSEVSLRREGERVLQGGRDRVSSLASRLEAVSPMGTIARGFAVVTRGDGGVVDRVGAVGPRDSLHIRVTDGIIDGEVVGTRRTAE